MSDEELVTSVTIKYPEAKRYAGAPWAVFRGSGSQIKFQIKEYFGFEQDYVDSISLHELVLAAQSLVQGSSNAAALLGAVPTGDSGAKSESTGSVWDQVDGEAGGQQRTAQAENPHAGLIRLLEAAETVDDLKRLWATNKDAFKDEAVQEAYSTRGKALKAAAA